MADHRYWRLFITRSGGNDRVAIGELILATTPSGPQAATGGIASASSTYGSDVASKAFDGVTSSTNYWRSDGVDMRGYNASQYIQYDMGAGNAIDVVEMRLYYDGSSAGSGTYPAAFSLLYSDDGITWRLQRSWKEQVFTNGETKTYDATPLPSNQVFNRTFARFDYRRNSAMNLDTPPRVRRVYPSTSPVAKTPWSGGYFIAGSTTVLGMPFARRVDLVDQKSGLLAKRFYTQKDGQFRFEHIGPGPWTVVGVDNSAEQNSVIYAHVHPALMT